MSEDDFAVEPIEGLPELLPKGEVILWQGRPNWLRLTIESLNLWWVIGYFGLLAAWRFLSVIDYMPFGTSISASIPFLFVAAFVGLLLCLCAMIPEYAYAFDSSICDVISCGSWQNCTVPPGWQRAAPFYTVAACSLCVSCTLRVVTGALGHAARI